MMRRQIRCFAFIPKCQLCGGLRWCAMRGLEKLRVVSPLFLPRQGGGSSSFTAVCSMIASMVSQRALCRAPSFQIATTNIHVDAVFASTRTYRNDNMIVVPFLVSNVKHEDATLVSGSFRACHYFNSTDHLHRSRCVCYTSKYVYYVVLLSSSINMIYGTGSTNALSAIFH